jgi:hypothetical protein
MPVGTRVAEIETGVWAELDSCALDYLAAARQASTMAGLAVTGTGPR